MDWKILVKECVAIIAKLQKIFFFMVLTFLVHFFVGVGGLRVNRLVSKDKNMCLGAPTYCA